jgi:hypothetical protein
LGAGQNPNLDKSTNNGDSWLGERSATGFEADSFAYVVIVKQRGDFGAVENLRNRGLWNRRVFVAFVNRNLTSVAQDRPAIALWALVRRPPRTVQMRPPIFKSFDCLQQSLER